MTSIYLDVCCLNRPFDDQDQPRIRLESEAILMILAEGEQGQWTWVGSELLTWEISKTPDPEAQAACPVVGVSHASHSLRRSI